MVFAVGYLLPLVHVPPRGVWGGTGPVARTTLEGWLGRPLDGGPSIDDLGHPLPGGLRAGDGHGRPGLVRPDQAAGRRRTAAAAARRRSATTNGRELFDLPDAPRPDPDTPAPPRFLPEYDNVLIGHADRSRIIPAGRRIPLPPGNGATRGTILVDGMFAGEWRIATDGGRATLDDRAVRDDPARRTARRCIDEGARLLAFAAAGTEARIVVGNRSADRNVDCA